MPFLEPDPDWYVRRWLTARAPSPWARLRRRLARAIVPARPDAR